MAGRRTPSTRTVTPTELGMLMGLIAGAAVGVLLFAITINALWLTLPGVGLTLGLGVGATIEKRNKRDGSR